jgi:methyl-accepting chemotaxis protein
MPSLAEVSSNLEQISSLLNHVVNLSTKIGGFGDGPHLREQIQADVRQLTTLSQTVKNAMTELRQTGGPTFDSYQSRFEDLRARMQSELRPVIEKLRSSTTPSASGGGGGGSVASEPLLSQQLVDSETDLIDVLEQQVNQILTTMREVNQLFTHVMTELQKQRHMITAIDAETTEAVSEMSTGNRELEKAGEHQKSSTKCICWIVIIVLLVVTAVGLIIAWQLVWKGGKPTGPTPMVTPQADPGSEGAIQMGFTW